MKRNLMAVLVAPVFLRLLLGVTFVWAGLGKVMQEMEYSGADAEKLAQWGVVGSGSAKPAETNPTETKPADAAAPASDAASPSTAPAHVETPASSTSQAPSTVRAYPLYGIALALDKAASPAPKADGTPGMALVPAQVSDGKTAIVLAWAATITEIGAGVLVLIGLLTRLSAFSLACVMAVAMWLTQIGPALAASNTKLGFLPNLPAFDPGWQTLLLQFILFCASLALMFAGAGMLSLDRLLFVRPEVIVKPVAVTPAA